MLHAQKFLKHLLNSRMKSLMTRYSQVNDSFITIKQNTSIKTTDEFLKNFIMKEQIYGELLDSIARAEEKINMLKE